MKDYRDNGWNNEDGVVQYQQTGDLKLRNEIVERNQAFVKDEARKFYNPKSFLEFEDLVNEGNIGFMRAIEKYDIHKGVKFISYAGWWVRQAIMRAITEKSRMIRVPNHVVDDWIKLRKVEETYSRNSDGEMPSPEYLASHSGIELDVVEKRLRAKSEVVSYDEYISKNTEHTFETIIKRKDFDQVLDDFENSLLVEKLFETAGLSDKSKEVLLLRNGFNGEKPMSLKAVGKVFGLKPESIRQRQITALKKLRRTADKLELEFSDINR